MIDGRIWLHRKIVNSEIWDGPALRLKLFIWILLEARFKDNGVLKRGQLSTTMSQLRDAVTFKKGYVIKAPSEKTIRRYIKWLVDHSMCVLSDDPSRVPGVKVITVLNYGEYQSQSKGVGPAVCTEAGPKTDFTPIIDNKENKEKLAPAAEKSKQKSPKRDCPKELLTALELELVPAKFMEFAKKKSIKIHIARIEFCKFVEWHVAKGSQFANWYMAWQKWIRKHKEIIRPKFQDTNPQDKATYTPDMWSTIATFRAEGKTDDELRDMGFRI